MHEKPTRVWAAILVAVGVSLLVAHPVRAEMLIDIYGGASFTSDAYTSSDGISGGAKTSYDPSGEVGGRFGYWIDSVPWLGLSLDVSYFSPSVSLFGLAPSIDVVPVSMLLMLRAPLLKDERFPSGRLQPYAALGPSAYIASYEEAEFSFGPKFKDTTATIGLDGRVGLKFLFAPWVGMFAEYRYTYAKPTWKDGGTTIQTSLTTNHVLAGVGFHF